MKKIGVLALQGDFEAHRKAVERAGGEGFEVRTAADLARADALILPGGESTTMLKLLEIENLFEPLRQYGLERPIFGTCAGAILMASEVLSPSQKSLGLMDLTVERNAYGRQLDSRVAHIEVPGNGQMEAVFIRAPIIRRAGNAVKVLLEYQGDPVLVEQGRHLVATFHPELTADPTIHRLFLAKLQGCANKT